ncbi:hypothetical protein INT46_009185 [Mucor plumbeus]|uniref:WH1 domain-containing protein n=1 Tax=Mucor plumbeus TaxID=97098 RepID=A0A8H7V693_9FUNG|nr:hypothetical protein INT46_009185 [Mucor plumbeus]
MKSATLPRAEDKRIVRNALPSSNIFTAAVARLYLAFENEKVWKYSGLWGAMAFCKDRNKNNSYFLRLIDLENNQGVVWEQELYIGFQYTKECAFLHSFGTDDCLAGILFVHQGEADIFHEKVIARETIKLKEKTFTQKSDVGRVRFTPGKGFTVDNNDPEILEILRELEKLEDFSAADIDQNQDFIQDFIRQYRSSNKKSSSKRVPPPPPPSRNRSAKSSAPPPIPPMMTRPNSIASVSPSPPPPPVPNRGIRQSPSIPSFNIRVPGSINGVPPPPPPPPPRGSPIPNGAPAPPPPPPMPISSNLTATAPNISPSPNADGRNNLMAAIRSTGGFGSLKKSGTLKAAAINQPESAPVRSFSQSNPSKNDMTSSLAAALQQRKTALQSDGSDDSDDDDWK